MWTAMPYFQLKTEKFGVKVPCNLSYQHCRWLGNRGDADMPENDMRNDEVGEISLSYPVNLPLSSVFLGFTLFWTYLRSGVHSHRIGCQCLHPSAELLRVSFTQCCWGLDSPSAICLAASCWPSGPKAEQLEWQRTHGRAYVSRILPHPHLLFLIPPTSEAGPVIYWSYMFSASLIGDLMVQHSEKKRMRLLALNIRKENWNPPNNGKKMACIR